jgi:hypothetical protein
LGSLGHRTSLAPRHIPTIGVTQSCIGSSLAHGISGPVTLSTTSMGVGSKYLSPFKSGIGFEMKHERSLAGTMSRQPGTGGDILKLLLRRGFYARGGD